MALTGDFVSGQATTFQRLRDLVQMLEGIQEGVVGAGDCKVSQHLAGNMSVDIAAGDFWVQLDTGTRPGLGHGYNDSVANPAVTAAHATLPRIDRVGIQWNDANLAIGTGGNIPTFRVIAGTATSGATLDNLTGAAAIPNDFLLLADLLIPAASTGVLTANIRDRRKWSRGAYSNILNTSGNKTTTSANNPPTAAIDATNWSPRIELSGVPVRLRLSGRLWNTIASGGMALSFQDNGANIEGGMVGMVGFTQAATQDPGLGEPFTWDLPAPAAGSHVLVPVWAIVSGGTATYGMTGVTTGNPARLIIEEIVRPNANNT